MKLNNEELMYDYFKKIFIKIMMKGGNKSTVEGIFEEAFLHLRKKLLQEDPSRNPKQLFVEVLSKSGPLAVVVTKRRGRRSIQVPMALEGKRRIAITSKWILEGARARNDKTMGLRLAKELFALSTGQGKAIKNQTLMHKQAYANRFNTNF
jgi:small subunit ribosomal protein S7